MLSLGMGDWLALSGMGGSSLGDFVTITELQGKFPGATSYMERVGVAGLGATAQLQAVNKAVAAGLANKAPAPIKGETAAQYGARTGRAVPAGYTLAPERRSSSGTELLTKVAMGVGLFYVGRMAFRAMFGKAKITRRRRR